MYFAASIRGGWVYAALYKRIIDYIKKIDIVLTEHIGKSNMSLKAQTHAICGIFFAMMTGKLLMQAGFLCRRLLFHVTTKKVLSLSLEWIVLLPIGTKG